VLLNPLLDQQVVFGGKGGVGKTTCCRRSRAASQRGGVSSCRPTWRSTADIFRGRSGPEVELGPGSWGSKSTEGKRADTSPTSSATSMHVQPSVIRQAHGRSSRLPSPGLREVALLDRNDDPLVDAVGDLIVVTRRPPTHAQLLRMPDAVGADQALVKHRRAVLGSTRPRAAQEARKEDPVPAALGAGTSTWPRFAGSADRRTSFALARRWLVIEETARAAEMLGWPASMSAASSPASA
jgi:hypothetical protein